jgi:flagellar biosynthesis/type III secretory pathway chaperone
MMNNTLDHLAACLSEKEEILEKLVLLLDRERDRIVELDIIGIEDERENKLSLVERLGQAKITCKKALEDASLELGLTREATLSALVGAVEPSRRAVLAESRKRLFELINALNKSNRCNRDLLHGSLRIVTRSLEFYNNSFGVVKTYSGAGRMVTGLPGGRLVSGEI